MAGWTNAALAAFLLQSVGKSVTFPTTFFCGLATSDPGVGSATFTNIASGSAAGEPAAATGGYQRQEVDIADLFSGTPTLANPSVGATLANDAEVTFGASSAAYSTGATALTHGFIAASGTEQTNDVILSWELPTSITVNAANITPRFAIGSIVLGGTTSSPT